MEVQRWHDSNGLSVVPSLSCRRGEGFRKDTGNRVKFAKMVGVGDGRGPCNRIAGECYQISLGSGASEAAELFTVKIVTKEKRSLHKISGAMPSA